VPLLAAEQGWGADCVAHDAVAAAAANRCDLIQYADDGRFAQVPATITSRDSCIQGLERMTGADMSRPSATNNVLKSTRKPTRHNEHRMETGNSGASLSLLSRKLLQLPPQSSVTGHRRTLLPCILSPAATSALIIRLPLSAPPPFRSTATGTGGACGGGNLASFRRLYSSIWRGKQMVVRREKQRGFV
jgi:hypothetical protein